MLKSFVFGFVDEFEKEAAKKSFLQKGLRAIKKIPGKLRSKADDIAQNARDADKAEPTGGGANLLVKQVQGKIRGMKPGPLKSVLRRGSHEVRKVVQERKADMDPETARKAEKAGARVVEQGAHAAKPVRRLMSYGISKAHPLSRKITIGGRAKEAPDITKHEVGHLSGYSKKHPVAATALNMASRGVGPSVAKGLAHLGKERAAKAVQGVSSAVTLGEEGRAWVRGKGKDIQQTAKKKGVINKEMGGHLRDAAIGLGSYAHAARQQHKNLGTIAAKARERKAAKKV